MCLSISFLSSCQSTKEQKSIGLKYYPSLELLKKGIVNKYYAHAIIEAEKYDTNTHIFYNSYLLIGDTLHYTNYINEHTPEFSQ